MKREGEAESNRSTTMSHTSKPLDAEERRKFEEARERWSERCRHLTEAIDRSERLTEADLAVRINTR